MDTPAPIPSGTVAGAPAAWQEPHPPNRVQGAGAIIYRQRQGAVEVLLVYREHYGDCTFPKGKRKRRDADPLATAMREVLEETGLVPTPERLAGATHYIDHASRPKHVQYFLMRVDRAEQVARPRNEVGAVRWCRINEVTTNLSYWHDKLLFLQVQRGLRSVGRGFVRQRPFGPLSA